MIAADGCQHFTKTPLHLLLQTITVEQQHLLLGALSIFDLAQHIFTRIDQQ